MYGDNSSEVTSDAGSRSVVERHFKKGVAQDSPRSGRAVLPLRPRERLVLSMELQGVKVTEIAAALGMNAAAVYNLRQKARYAAAFNAKLDEIDDEFLHLKPKVLRALDNGLESADESVGLKAADTWFKMMGYKGYARVPEAPSHATAEDIAASLLAAGGGSVTIAVERSDATGLPSPGEPEETQPPQGQATSP